MNFQNILVTEGVRKVERGEGEKLNIAGAHLMWRAKSEDTGYAFSICEQRLAPAKAFRCLAMLPSRCFMLFPSGVWNSLRALMPGELEIP